MISVLSNLGKEAILSVLSDKMTKIENHLLERIIKLDYLFMEHVNGEKKNPLEILLQWNYCT